MYRYMYSETFWDVDLEIIFIRSELFFRILSNQGSGFFSLPSLPSSCRTLAWLPQLPQVWLPQVWLAIQVPASILFGRWVSPLLSWPYGVSSSIYGLSDRRRGLREMMMVRGEETNHEKQQSQQLSFFCFRMFPNVSKDLELLEETCGN